MKQFLLGQRNYFTSPDFNKIENSKFGFCPVCNGNLKTNKTHIGDRFGKIILFCLESYETHFKQMFEQEIINDKRDELRQWEKRSYFKGNVIYEIIYRTFFNYPDIVIQNDTYVRKITKNFNIVPEVEEIYFENKIPFPTSMDKVIKKTNNLLILK